MQALPAGLGWHQPVPWGSQEGRQSLFEIPRGISAIFIFLLRRKLISQIYLKSISQLKTEIIEQGKVQKRVSKPFILQLGYSMSNFF